MLFLYTSSYNFFVSRVPATLTALTPRCGVNNKKTMAFNEKMWL